MLCRAARQLDTLMQALTVPLTRYVADFPAPEALHPFERALLELTVGEERYVTALARVTALRKPLSEVRPTLSMSLDPTRAPTHVGSLQPVRSSVLADSGYRSLVRARLRVMSPAIRKAVSCVLGNHYVWRCWFVHERARCDRRCRPLAGRQGLRRARSKVQRQEGSPRAG